MSEGAEVLIVDDEAEVCNLLRDELTSRGIPCTAITDGRDAVRMLTEGDFRVAIADIMMPGVSGLDVLARARASNPDCKVILITGVPSTESLTAAISGGAYDYLTKPFDVDRLVETIRQARRASQDRTGLSVRAAEAMWMSDQSRHVSLESIQALVQTVEAKDPNTRRHSEHVAEYAFHLASLLGMSRDRAESVRLAALVHDVGKISIPDDILTKPGPLSEAEYAVVRRHPIVGEEIVRNIRIFAGEARIIRSHHEWWNGQGYPDGLSGEDIPVGARIVNITDSLDAMLKERTYKLPYEIDYALGELTRAAGTQFDPDLVDTTVRWCRQNPDDLFGAQDVA